MECLRLMVKDVDFSSNEIRVRSGKGDKDRVTMLPGAVKEPLLTHLQGVKGQHERMFKRIWSCCPARCAGTQISKRWARMGLAVDISCNQPLH